MFGVGWAELLIICIMLMVMITVLVGSVVLIVSLARRRGVGPGRSSFVAPLDGDRSGHHGS